MKLLNCKEVKVNEDGISFTIKPVTKALQIGYINAAYTTSGESDFVRQMALVDYILSDCITDLVIDGVEYDPVEYAENSNLMDGDTQDKMRQIYTMAYPALEGLSAEDEKKSE